MASTLLNKSLYVGDLAESVTEKTLTEFFKDFTIISMRLIHFTPSNSFPRTYAFVNFSTHDEAEKALSLTYSPINGKPCRIAWLNRDSSTRRQGIANVFVKNLRLDIDPKKLAHAFSIFGHISSCKVVTDQNGHSKGYGFVQFKTEEEARKAILATEDMNDKGVQGIVDALKAHDKPLMVKKFIPRTQRMQEIANTWTNLFVKNIDASVTQREFEDLCEKFGRVKSCKLVAVPHDRKTTFGFANYETHEAAVHARNELHGHSLKGSLLEAFQHKTKQERLLELEKNRRSLTNLYIKNLDDKIDEEKLRQEFSDEKLFSPIKSLKIERDEKGYSKGFGYVNLTTPEGALAAISRMHHKTLTVNGVHTKPIYVALHEPKEIRNRRLQQHMMRTPHLFYHQYVPPYPPPPPVVPSRYPYRPAPYSAPMPVTSNQPRTTRPSPAVRSSQPPKQVRPPPQTRPLDSSQVPTPLTVSILQQYYPEQQRLLLGERLYPLIAKTQPSYAGKITGMLLDSGWKIEDLLNLLTNEEKLNASINEAVSLLQKEQARSQPQPPMPISGKIPGSTPLPVDIRLYPIEQQRTSVAERLFYLVSSLTQHNPQEITKSLLHIHPLDDLFTILEDPNKLKRAVDDVLSKK